MSPSPQHAASPKRSVRAGRKFSKSMFAMKISSCRQNIDVAFLAIHGTFGEDGQIQQILEDRGVPYTGDGVKESRTAFDKIESKKKFEAAGVTTPRWQIIGSNERPTLSASFRDQGATTGLNGWRLHY